MLLHPHAYDAVSCQMTHVLRPRFAPIPYGQLALVGNCTLHKPAQMWQRCCPRVMCEFKHAMQPVDWHCMDSSAAQTQLSARAASTMCFIAECYYFIVCSLVYWPWLAPMTMQGQMNA